MRPPVILRIFKGQQLIDVKQFDKDQVIFGSESEAQVILKDDAISALHCLLELRESGYYISDLGSATGTQKNNKIVLDAPLSSGDNIQVGPYRIQFFLGVPSQPKAADVFVPPTTPKSEPTTKKAEVPPPPVMAPAPPKLPEAQSLSAFVAKGSSNKNSKKNRKTFAPPSSVKDLKEYLKPTKGPVVEVIVAWQERVIHTYHFQGDRNITIGSVKTADVFVPHPFLKGVAPFIELKGGCRILAGMETSFDSVISAQSRMSQDDLQRLGKVTRTNVGQALRLDQGEVACLSMAQGVVQIFVRYVPVTNKPLLAMPLDFTAGELTGIVVSLVIVALTALYMSVYTPEEPDPVEEEKLRLAQFVYNKPKEELSKATLDKVEQEKPPEKKQAEIKDKMTEQKGNPASPNKVSQQEAAKAAEVRANNTKNRPKKFTSVKQGGAVKLSEKGGSNAQSKDVTKMGLAAAFGGGGVRKQLDQAYSGSGDILGMAQNATGKAGQNENRGGEDIGSRFKDTGAGGKGTATQGIAGIGTKGRGSGMSTYGSGVGLGGKGNVTIDAGGSDEAWEGSLDREAIRRTIMSILNQIKSCYERRLKINSSLEGKVVIEFEIIEQGQVSYSKVKSSTLKDQNVESCVAARIENTRFPEPPTGLKGTVTYPFVFGAQK